jgi:2-(1,2-epoxy-1,2-dihydrophenyl)acetyl-CoA isomerase
LQYEAIKYSVDNRVAAITLNRPERMNAFGEQMRRELPDAVARADRDSEVRAEEDGRAVARAHE